MSKENPWVHVIGGKTIADPIIYFLLEVKDEIGISTVSFHERILLLEKVPETIKLIKKGVRLVVDKKEYSEFIKLGVIPYSVHEAAMDSADIVINCTPGESIEKKICRKFANKYPDKRFVTHDDAEPFRLLDLFRLLKVPDGVDKTPYELRGEIVYGNFFMPQFTHTVLSLITVTLWFLDPETYREKMKVFDKFLFDEI